MDSTAVKPDTDNEDTKASSEDVTPPSDAPKEPKNNNSGDISFNKDITLLPHRPIPHLSKGEVTAYAAKGSGKITPNLFVLTCARHLSPRTNDISKYASIINPNIARLIASGTAKWSDGVERYCLIYEDTLGQPIILRDQKSVALGWKPELLMAHVIKPLIHVLMDMRDKDLIHGEICVGNLFDGGSALKDKIQVGECLSAPPSSQIPALYEPIERAMADPVGRGLGTNEDELYAFGVTLAILVRNADPMEGASDDEIIASKIEKGSYLTLMGNQRLSGAVLELLRGLLYDDKAQRWGYDEIQAWLDGRRLSPKQSPKRIKANRPIEFNDVKYVRPELFAKDLYKNPLEVMRLSDAGEIQMWLDRAIEDKTIKTRMETTIESLPSSRSENFSHQLTARIATALNPDMPVRYRGLSFMPEGFGKSFSAAYAQGNDIQPYIDIIKSQFLLQIIRQRQSVDQQLLINKFDSARTFITQTKVGSGLERCVYSFDPSCPCLSPTLKDYYVTSPESLVRSLNDLAEKSGKPERILDRHMIAFLSVKDRKNVDPYIIELGAEQKHRQVMGEVRVLATIQKRSRLEDFPALALWVSKRFTPIYERFHDRNKRESLKKHVEKVAANGDLTRLAFLLEDEHLYENDFYTFKQAMDEFQSLEKERQKIEKKLEVKKGYGSTTGRQIASFIALFVSIVFILITAFTMLTNGMNL